MSKILIVEDNPMNMRLFVDLLQAQNYEVFQCFEGIKAFDMVMDIRPDLILMDIQLPVISGLEITEKIRQNPIISSIPIIAITAFAMKGDEKMMLEKGCNAYISKPISVPYFLETVKKYLAK